MFLNIVNQLSTRPSIAVHANAWIAISTVEFRNILKKGCFMLNSKVLHLLGYASGIAGAQTGSGQGPLMMQNSTYLLELITQDLALQWDTMLQPNPTVTKILPEVVRLCEQLSSYINKLAQKKQRFVVIGGDHTSAIGTWSGAAHAKRDEGNLGLIWIDAHMDSHTPDTSATGNLHGMPVAALLGHGSESLTQLCDRLPKLLPQNICLIGVRSFERAEAELLQKLNVQIFYMKEIEQRGIEAVLLDAIKLVSRNTVSYGVSIDIDSVDPTDAPGTGVVEPNGIKADQLCNALTLLTNDSRLIGYEIAEFDPTFDQQHKTEKLIARMILAIELGKQFI